MAGIGSPDAQACRLKNLGNLGNKSVSCFLNLRTD